MSINNTAKDTNYGKDEFLDHLAHDVTVSYNGIPGHGSLDFNKRQISGFSILKIYDDDRLDSLIDPESDYTVENISVDPNVDGLPCSIDLVLQERSDIAILIEHLGEWPSPAIIHKYVDTVLIDPADLADRIASLYASAISIVETAHEEFNEDDLIEAMCPTSR